MGQPSETATGPSDDSVSSVSTRHHQSESEEVHSSAKPTKPMEKKIAPAHTNSNIVRNKPAGKEIAPGLKSSSNSMSSMGKKIAPGGNKPVGKKIAPRDTISTQYFYNSSSEVAGEMSPPRRQTVTLHEARPVKRPREESPSNQQRILLIIILLKMKNDNGTGTRDQRKFFGEPVLFRSAHLPIANLNVTYFNVIFHGNIR